MVLLRLHSTFFLPLSLLPLGDVTLFLMLCRLPSSFRSSSRKHRHFLLYLLLLVPHLTILELPPPSTIIFRVRCSFSAFGDSWTVWSPFSSGIRLVWRLFSKLPSFFLLVT